MRHLEDYPWYREYPGAGSIAFHRWLPDGEADALIVPLKRWRGELKLWVERFGYSDNHGFINFDQGRREIDEKSLKRQAVVFSGPLFGYLKMEILRADMEAVRRGTAQYEQHQRSHNAPDSFDYYSDFGKIVAGILGELLESFFDLIRFNYGQYWLEPFKRWDSRDRKLGSYFGSVLAKWSDDNAIWHDFRPTARQEVARVRPRPWDQFLTEQDWRDIGDALRRKIRPEPAGMMLARANRFLDEGEVATALVEGITALEIAISSFMAQRLNRSGIGEIGRFKDLPVESRLRVIMAVLEPAVESRQAEAALEAIHLRNEFIHRAAVPPQEARENAKALFAVISRLLGPPGPKLPNYTLASGMLYPSEPP